MLKNHSKNPTPEHIRDMVNLVTELQNANRFLLASDCENLGGNIHRYEDLLTPWCQYFGDTMSKTLQAAKRMYTLDIFPADFVKLIGELIELIQHEIKKAKADLFTLAIREMLANVDPLTPKEAYELVCKIKTILDDEFKSYLEECVAKAKAHTPSDSTKKPGVPTIKVTHVTKGNGQNT